MSCSVPHNLNEITALVDQLIAEDRARQQALYQLAMQFEKAFEAKDVLRQAYQKCQDLPPGNRAQIETFLSVESTKDYEMYNSMFRKAGKIEKQVEGKYIWLNEKYT